MVCPSERGDNPRVLSPVQTDTHVITILFHLHLCYGTGRIGVKLPYVQYLVRLGIDILCPHVCFGESWMLYFNRLRAVFFVSSSPYSVQLGHFLATITFSFMEYMVLTIDQVLFDLYKL